MSEDTDLAMALSSERISRVKAEQRLLGLLYDIVPFFIESMRMAEGVISVQGGAMDQRQLSKAQEEITQSLSTVIKWSGDLSLQMLMVMCDYVQADGVNPWVEMGKGGRASGGLQKLMGNEDKGLQLLAKEAAIANYKEWDQKATVHGFESREEANNHMIEHFMTMVDRARKTMNKMDQMEKNAKM